ncbi:hypothetical protein CHLRE_07g329150v5 [Chlamydomonas reinhardtii]|uniref:RNA helicase n=1 Tax=Chlamydomonas reinhardtii TaxID=3055 RepID=A0A2K3DJQ8_CHLRE|nr:uncharacterized protein CHLRE_07g329150v5 [Chlamydomonas reinhardtii]XP_042922718.1 uncharacterized protein CHLRE_07g329150v5 [Chlamydomonas reinhardtii]PNW80770.1 hypothetical protein CHLRE_07g329150v5 [Chlamydomonas reinhardtii]PNW80771.1 hypothetical protein CHLRE_07g329150v5 [Chlamydomonas reinhardtii]
MANTEHEKPRPKKQRRSGELRENDAAAAERRRRIDAERRQLPAWAARDKLLALLQQHRTLVLVGETGSGKTTQIPQFLLAAKFGKSSGSKGAVPDDGADEGAAAGPGPGSARTAATAPAAGGHRAYGGGQCIAVTQPRRVAAMTVARRVAEEMGTKIGQQVGYAIRFEDVTSPATRIKYMTDGLLLREALVDPLLSRYRVVVIDEAHERTVHTDVLLGLIKGVQARRGDDFRLVVMSATLDAARFVDYFPGAVAALVRGRQFPVQVLYTARPEDNYLDAAINATLQVHGEEPEGDVLVFLTGQDEIDSAERLLKDRLSSLPAAARMAGVVGAAAELPGEEAAEGGGGGVEGGGGGPAAAEAAAAVGGRPRELLVLPIYAALPPEQQMKVFEPAPPGTRKAILATNIAETSITIPGVRYVIDTGHVKARDYNAKLGLESLAVVPVSQAQARQRSGRAGREGPGKAYRLYTEADFSQLAATTPPEITRCNLASVVLQLKAMGIDDVLGFDFMDPPPRTAILRSLELLFALGALDNSGKLTEEVGLRLSRLPVDPMFGRVLLAAAELGCGVEALAVVAMVSADNVFHTPRQKEAEWRAARLKFLSREGDHLTLLNVFRGFMELPKESHKARTGWCSDNFINIRALRKAEDIYTQLVRFMGHPCPPGLGLPLATCGDETTPLRRALTAGLFPHAARLQPDGSYRVIATGRQVFLHPSSVLLERKPDCLVFNELMHTTRTYARDATAIEARWLPELAPAFFAAKASAATAGVSAAGAAR